jgi:hypothetical protein
MLLKQREQKSALALRFPCQTRALVKHGIMETLFFNFFAHNQGATPKNKYFLQLLIRKVVVDICDIFRGRKIL